jgi:hypothetical protein
MGSQLLSRSVTSSVLAIRAKHAVATTQFQYTKTLRFRSSTTRISQITLQLVVTLREPVNGH